MPEIQVVTLKKNTTEEAGGGGRGGERVGTGGGMIMEGTAFTERKRIYTHLFFIQ